MQQHRLETQAQGLESQSAVAPKPEAAYLTGAVGSAAEITRVVITVALVLRFQTRA